MNERPILGISMGDPFGNGPEITVRALADKSVYDRCRPLVVGDKTSMEYAGCKEDWRCRCENQCHLQCQGRKV